MKTDSAKKGFADSIRVAAGLKQGLSHDEFQGILEFFRIDAVMPDWNLLPPLVELTPKEFVLPQDFREKHFKLLGFHMLQRKWLVDLENRLISENFPVMVMKGHGLWGTVYSEKYLRISADIDLLVEPEHYPKMEQILNETATIHGHTQLHTRYDLGFPYFFRVELHWDLVAYKSFSINFENIWERSRVHPLFESGKILAMSLEDAFIHTVIHSFNHRSLLNYMMVDIIRMLESEEFDHESVRKSLQEAGCNRLTKLTMDRIEQVVEDRRFGVEFNLDDVSRFYRWCYSYVFKDKEKSPFEMQRLLQFLLLDKVRNRLSNFCGSYLSFVHRGIKKLTHPHDGPAIHSK